MDFIYGLGPGAYPEPNRDNIMMVLYAQTHGNRKTSWKFLDCKGQHSIDEGVVCVYCNKITPPNYETMYVTRPGFGYEVEAHVKCHKDIQRKWFNQVMCIFKHIFKQSGWKVIYKHVFPYILFNIEFDNVSKV